MLPRCVLLTNEPPTYRDTFAAALRMLRPDIEVIVDTPEHLDAAIARYAPSVVICSQLTPTVETHVPVWIVLYPNGAQSALCCVHGERTTIAEIDLASIVNLIDLPAQRAEA